MKLCVFVSHFRFNTDTYDRLKAEKLDIIFVQNGVYHAALKENDKTSPLLEKAANFYVLRDDLETHGFTDLMDAEDPYGELNTQIVPYAEIQKAIEAIDHILFF